MPILLHLVKREHARKMEFPTLMFLRRISKKTIRYQKLRHLLLLLLRVLSLVLIALAFTRPYFAARQKPAFVGRSACTHIIALDNSMSMGYRDRWDRAKEAALKIVRSMNPGDKVAVLEFSDRVWIRTQATMDADEALVQIRDGIELTDRSTLYGQALKAAEGIAVHAGTEKSVIYLISDFQKNAWEPDNQELRLGAAVELRPVDVGSKDFSNLAFRDVRIETSDAAGAGVILRAALTCFGTKDRSDVGVRLLMDNRTVAEKRIDILQGETRTIDFPLQRLNPGIHAITCEVEDAELERDNRFYLAFEMSDRIPVYAVEASNASAERSPSFFLAKALNVDNLSPYKLMLASSVTQAFEGKLIIWNDAPGGDQAVQRKLRDFVQAGGGLAIVVSDSSRATDFNRSFGSWLPVTIAAAPAKPRKQVRPAEDYVLMTDIRKEHPIFRLLGRPYSGVFSSAKFYAHAKLLPGAEAEILASFDNGDPALVSVNAGKGRVVIFASSADDSSNDFPLKPLYAPFWQQVMRYLEGYKERRYWYNVGEMLSLDKLIEETTAHKGQARVGADQAVAVIDPQKRRLPTKQN